MELNPPPSEGVLRAQEQAAIGRTPAEEGGPGVPPTGPVVTGTQRRSRRAEPAAAAATEGAEAGAPDAGSPDSVTTAAPAPAP
jgi:hypothetical protein